jgi:hypothetical protein
MTWRSANAGAALVLVLAGCDADMRPPPPPGPDGATIGPGPMPMRRDGGGIGFDATVSDADTDIDGGFPPGCIAAGSRNNATLVLDGAEYRFEPTTAFVSWGTGSRCAVPTLVIGLSERGCAPGLAPELLFLIEREEIGVTVVMGANDVEFAGEGLSVVFDGESNDWQTCFGATGQIDFDVLGSEPGERIEASFDLTLVDCKARESPLMVRGDVAVTIETSYDDACL